MPREDQRLALHHRRGYPHDPQQIRIDQPGRKGKAEGPVLIKGPAEGGCPVRADRRPVFAQLEPCQD